MKQEENPTLCEHVIPHLKAYNRRVQAFFFFFNQRTHIEVIQVRYEVWQMIKLVLQSHNSVKVRQFTKYWLVGGPPAVLLDKTSRVTEL